MTTRYVGIGGNDGNDGSTWALRKLTLNGIEDIPVAASDIVYVGPGTYRELLTTDVSGGAGTEIVYIGDVSGEHTNDVGGIVRITGSDNDTTGTRAYCVNGAGDAYRTFRGFQFDMATTALINGTEDHWIVEDCVFLDSAGTNGIQVLGDNQSDWIIRRSIFVNMRTRGIALSTTNLLDNIDHLVENCLFISVRGDAIYVQRAGDCIVRNCLFLGTGDDAIDIATSVNAGHPLVVNNCIFTANAKALEATILGDITENYNTFWSNGVDRTLVNIGAQSQIYPDLLVMPILHSGASQASGFKFPWWFGELSEWSQIAQITGTNEPTEDLLGILRPVTASKNSWGVLQFHDTERETTTVHGGSTASIVFHDAGRHQMWVPVANESTTISVYVYREANYAGNNPQMIIKQPGQADDVTTDAAAAVQWNLLTTTLTPAADPPYVVVELVSRNTAAALAYETFFDDLAVS